MDWKTKHEAAESTNAALREEVERLERWVDDLQAGMSINCVYCGHNYGPDDEIPVSMAETLKEHVEQCPKHPMSALKAEVERLREEREEARDVLRWHMGEIWDGSSVDGFEFQDELEKRGLIVEVEASQEIRDEFDTDVMYVWKWSDLDRKATDAARGRG